MPIRNTSDEARPQLAGAGGTLAPPRLHLRHNTNAVWDNVTERRAATRERDAREDLIGQLREANQNLVLATLNAQSLRDAAVAVNVRQNEFLAMLAHELRNPLALISAAAALIGKTPDVSPQLCRLQAIIGRQVGNLARLLDDLLDAARINSGKVTLLLQPITLSDVIDRAIEAIQPFLLLRRQQLSVEMPAQAVAMAGDHVRLTQVFSNLLINASKFTPDLGRIKIRVTPLGDQVEVSIIDNGTGISADILPHIFDLFIQGPRSLARSEGGLGIGLSIVRNIVHMHGGTVNAHSAGLGLGSMFCVTLPVLDNPAPAILAAPAVARASHACRILLLEDNDDAAEMLKMLLELDSHAVSSVANGVAGLAMVREQVYDVIICDIGMPEMNGMDFVRTLRATASAALPLLLAVSGYGREQDRIDALAAGFDAYFVKPVDMDALSSAISMHALGRARAAP
ncbi:signal transduction histidine kinase/ActR/RegA family two-component response regulator [Oxalobacteraceae bacterium GrIS 1.11]